MPQLYNFGGYIVTVQSQDPSQLRGQAQAPFVALEVRLALAVELLFHAPRSKCEVLTEQLRYIIYFWVNEGEPTEPLHVHVCEGRPSSNGTKVWITRKGKAVICHNKSQIPMNRLRQICRFIEANSQPIEVRWEKEFGEVSYFC